MLEKKVTLDEAKETMHHIMNGVDPYSGEVVGKITVLEHPRTKACFSLVDELLAKCIDKAQRRAYGSRQKFAITEAVASTIEFPPGDIGVKGIISAVNQVVDRDTMSGLTIIALYGVLKELGILEKSKGEGKVRTTTTRRSAEYGIKTVKSTFQGEAYDRILYTDQGKDYIKKHLPLWFGQ